jgi:hypothetical protein
MIVCQSRDLKKEIKKFPDHADTKESFCGETNKEPTTNPRGTYSPIPHLISESICFYRVGIGGIGGIGKKAIEGKWEKLFPKSLNRQKSLYHLYRSNSDKDLRGIGKN